jgi:hypothetical protein
MKTEDKEIAERQQLLTRVNIPLTPNIERQLADYAAYNYRQAIAINPICPV